MWNIPIEAHIIKNDVLPFEYKDKSELLTSPDYVVIDNFDAADFNRNDCGWIRNDISALMRAQSKEEYDMLLRKLEVSNDTGSLPDGISKSDAIKRIKPRYAQSVVELEHYAEYIGRMDAEALDEAYRKATKDVHPDSPAGAPAPDGASVSAPGSK